MSSQDEYNQQQIQLPTIDENKDDINTYDELQLRFSSQFENDSELSEQQNLLQFKQPRIKRSKSNPASTISSRSSNSSSTSSKTRNKRRNRSKSLSHIQPIINRRRNRNGNQNILFQRRPSLLLLKSIVIEERLIASKKELDNPHEYTVDDAIEHIGMGKFQWIVFFITGIIWAADAMEIMLMAFLLPVFQKEFNISSLKSSLVPFSVLIGTCIGATVFSQLADKFGRKYIIIIGVFFTAVFAVASAFVDDIYSESVLRFFVGFSMSVACVAYTLFAEFIPSQKRGKILILQATFWSLGAMLSVTLGWITLTYLNWRWYIRLSTIPLWIAIIGIIFIPESPHYLLIDGQYEKAKEILNQISKINNKALPAGILHPSNGLHSSRKTRGRLSDIFCGGDGITPIFLLIVYSMCVFGYYGIAFVSVRYFTELDTIHHLHHEFYWEMMLTTFSEMPAILIGYFLVDYGQKIMMTVSFGFFSIFTYLLVFNPVEDNRGFGIFSIFMGRMWINLSIIDGGIYFMEFYPTYIRASALGFAVSFAKLFKMATIVSAESLEIEYAMYILGCSGLIGFLASLPLKKDGKSTHYASDDYVK